MITTVTAETSSESWDPFDGIEEKLVQGVDFSLGGFTCTTQSPIVVCASEPDQMCLLPAAGQKDRRARRSLVRVIPMIEDVLKELKRRLGVIQKCDGKSWYIGRNT